MNYHHKKPMNHHWGPIKHHLKKTLQKSPTIPAGSPTGQRLPTGSAARDRSVGRRYVGP